MQTTFSDNLLENKYLQKELNNYTSIFESTTFGFNDCSASTPAGLQ